MNKRHYINNRDLHEKYVNYYKGFDYENLSKKEYPELPESIKMDIYKIAKRSVKHSNFSGYSRHHDDMVSHAIIGCLIKGHKFNPFWVHPTKENYKPNPLSYLTTIIFNEFRHFLRKEMRINEIADREITTTIINSELNSKYGGCEVNYLKENQKYINSKLREDNIYESNVENSKIKKSKKS